jgi:hypothetical protein
MVEVLECEVCWAKETETNIYPYKNTHYCEQDLDRAIAEGWHNV